MFYWMILLSFALQRGTKMFDLILHNMPRVHYDAVVLFVVVYFVLFWWFGGCTIGYFFIHLIANMLFFCWLNDLSRNFVPCPILLFAVIISSNRFQPVVFRFLSLFPPLNLVWLNALLIVWCRSCLFPLLLNFFFSQATRVLVAFVVWDVVGMFVVTSSPAAAAAATDDDLDQTIFSLIQLSASQLSMTFAEHPRNGALKLAAACSWIW